MFVSFHLFSRRFVRQRINIKTEIGEPVHTRRTIATKHPTSTWNQGMCIKTFNPGTWAFYSHPRRISKQSFTYGLLSAINGICIVFGMLPSCSRSVMLFQRGDRGGVEYLKYGQELNEWCNKWQIVYQTFSRWTEHHKLDCSPVHFGLWHVIHFWLMSTGNWEEPNRHTDEELLIESPRARNVWNI